MTPRATIAATVTVLIVAGCGGSVMQHAGAGRAACVPAAVHAGPPPQWTASAWADSSPGSSIRYVLASGNAAAAFLFSDPLRPARSSREVNKILWVMRFPRRGQPLTVTATQPGTHMPPVHAQWPANSSPGEIYPSTLDVPRSGCWRVTLQWAGHRATVDLAVAATRTPVQPAALHGARLGRRTGLRLLVSADRPFVVNVDSGQITAITGVPVKSHPVISVQPVGLDAALWVDARQGNKTPSIYVVRHGSTRAYPVGTALQVAPADGGHGLWLLRQLTPDRCGLSEVTFAGAVVRRPVAAACSSQLIASGAVNAVLVTGHRVTDPTTGRILLRASTVWTVAGRRALLSRGSDPPLRLATLGKGKEKALRWPTRIGGTDEAATAPGGRTIAIDFGNPAYRSTATQIIDAWLLDSSNGQFHHLPGMPAAVLLKGTSMAWTPDGRLIILATLPSTRTVVAVWRPGQHHLEVRGLRLTDRTTNGSDTFAVW